ncbi:MAG: hypothetical protein OXI43_02645 [Candidatus Poribacteria bacterium]|nr:hypothetical protein [Candidatus Poribacteria bacterium]
MQTKSLYVFSLLTAAIFLLAADSLFADIATLKRIAEAERDVSYVGLRLRTYSSSRGARTMEEIVIHKTAENSYSKVESVVGEQRPANEENNRERRQDDGNEDRNDRRRPREFRWERQRSQFSPKQIKLIAQNYELERRHWGEKIAGYETDLLIIKPKHAGRPTKFIYFARKNSVFLRVEDLDAAGVLRRMFVYTRISFEPDTVKKKWESFKEENKPEPLRPRPAITLVDAEKILKKKPIQPTYLPPGFQLQSVHKRHFGGNHVQLKYTDGMLDFNIFQTTDKITRREGRNRGETEIQVSGVSVRKNQRGSTHTYGWSSTDTHFFLLSEIPDKEIEKVVKSIIQQAVQK